MENSNFTFDTFLSPFTWRYGSDEMRRIWSETYRRKLWRRVWVALAEAQCVAGLVTHEQVSDLRSHQEDIDLERAHTIESEIRHDLMAEVLVYAEQCEIGGSIIHLGATSADIEDNAEALRLRESLDLMTTRVRKLLTTLAELIEREAEHVCMAFTHIQPAEPTTIGYRLAGYAQDLLEDYKHLNYLRERTRGKGIKGAVGTSASYQELLVGTSLTPMELEHRVMKSLEIDAYLIATQTYPRRQDWEIINGLAGLAMSVYRMAFDLRILQSPSIDEWSEPFGAPQVGSSAMPFKRNPIHSENIDSLARFIAALPRIAWDNAAHNLLERTLDDSANRRIILPEAFLAAEEIVSRAEGIVSGLQINEHAVRHNLERYGVFAATERLLMESVRNGGDRQQLHEIIREHSMAAWKAIKQGESNPLVLRLCADKRIIQLVTPERVRELLDVTNYVGNAPLRARHMAQSIKSALERSLT
jgi:adenylosuccinate lyase